MRVSSREIQQVGLTSILNQQEKLSQTQQQVASGKRILKPSDDPVATTQILELRQSLDTTERFQQNAGAARDRLNTEEGILKNVTNLLQRVRELAVQGNNAVQSNETRDFIAAEVRQRLDELMGLANTRDGNGDYLFSGSQGGTLPFVRNGPENYTYNGDQNQRSIQVGSGRQVADGDSGADVFELIRNGNGTFVADSDSANSGTGVITATSVDGQFIPANPGTVANGYSIRFHHDAVSGDIQYEVYETADESAAWPQPAATRITSGTYTEGQPIEFGGARIAIKGEPAEEDTFTVKSSEYQDIFTTIEKLAVALERSVNSPEQRAQQTNEINRSLEDIDQGLGNILVVRSSVGSRINAIESQEYVNEDYKLQTKEVLSSLEDLDYAEAITRLNLELTGIEAAQKAYMKVQGLSMFDYLRL